MTKDEFDFAYLQADFNIWTADMVWLRFIEAVDTLRRLPEKWTPKAVKGVSLYIRDIDDEFGPIEADPDARVRRDVSKEAIDRMEQVFDWHRAWLSSPRMIDAGKALWVYSEAVNGRFSIRKACLKMGISPPTMYKRKDIAIHEVAERLSTSEIEVRQPSWELCLQIAV